MVSWCDSVRNPSLVSFPIYAFQLSILSNHHLFRIHDELYDNRPRRNRNLALVTHKLGSAIQPTHILSFSKEEF